MRMGFLKLEEMGSPAKQGLSRGRAMPHDPNGMIGYVALRRGNIQWRASLYTETMKPDRNAPACH